MTVEDHTGTCRPLGVTWRDEPDGGSIGIEDVQVMAIGPAINYVTARRAEARRPSSQFFEISDALDTQAEQVESGKVRVPGHPAAQPHADDEPRGVQKYGAREFVLLDELAVQSHPQESAIPVDTALKLADRNLDLANAHDIRGHFRISQSRVVWWMRAANRRVAVACCVLTVHGCRTRRSSTIPINDLGGNAARQNGTADCVDLVCARR